MATTGTVETEFEFLKDLPQRDSDWPDGLVNEIKSYTAAFKEHKGLIPQSAVPDLLQVSKQRFFQLPPESIGILGVWPAIMSWLVFSHLRNMAWYYS